MVNKPGTLTQVCAVNTVMVANPLIFYPPHLLNIRFLRCGVREAFE
jgi:hypothetical protein